VRLLPQMNSSKGFMGNFASTSVVRCFADGSLTFAAPVISLGAVGADEGHKL